jgi:hypothetical protein
MRTNARIPSAIKLKMAIKTMIIIGFLSFFSATTSFAQNYTAILDSDFHLQINENAKAGYSYLVDYSQVDLPAAELADEVKMYNSEHSTVLLDEETMELKLFVEMRGMPNWTISDWNGYLSTMFPQ